MYYWYLPNVVETPLLIPHRCVCEQDSAKPFLQHLHPGIYVPVIFCLCVRVCVYRWNQLDLAIVLLSVMGITLEEIEINASLPINPTIIRIMRVLRIARGKQTNTHTHAHTPLTRS